jgi:adenine-specific DNA methylase
MSPPKKLIEVALPLDAINKASAREKSIRHGHPSTLHLWWARRPLAAARAVIFAQMVDDPSAHPERFPTEEAQEQERQRLFRLIEELVLWENTTNEAVLAQAREEIWQSWRWTCAANQDHPHASELFNPEKLPAFHDPFAGGGSLPLEAQLLGPESYASDLNPVAVLICKAMIEIPPKFAGMPPVNPEARKDKSLIAKTWRGTQGLAEDVRYYGQWMRNEAEKRIGHLTALKAELPAALIHLQHGNIAPIDLVQAAIGPGMAVFTRYARVLDASGQPLSVREALSLISQTLDEVLTEQEGDFDADSRWALTWFEQAGFAEGEYGVAEQLSKSKNTSVTGMVEAGILFSRGGKVRLLRPDELPAEWDPATDPRLTAWEVVHHLIRVLETGGESAAAALVATLGSHAETARELAYRLYTLCERKKRASEALAYNSLVQSWPEIVRLAGQMPAQVQHELF